MKQILSILVIALFMTACESGTSETAENIPTLNPAHGQPYHDCSLSVGVPFVAKGADGLPAKKQVPLNPAHGQPGHSCDIAVGAPLI